MLLILLGRLLVFLSSIRTATTRNTLPSVQKLIFPSNYFQQSFLYFVDNELWITIPVLHFC